LIFQPQHFETCPSYLLRPYIPTLVSFLRDDLRVVCKKMWMRSVSWHRFPIFIFRTVSFNISPTRYP